MAIDLNKDTYTIKSITSDGSVVVVFDVDGKTQCLADVPLDDADTLTAWLSQYLAAYKAGLQIELDNATAPEVSSDIKSLLNQPQTAVPVDDPES